MKQDIYTQVTNRIIEALERGVAPWVCPWSSKGGGFPVNAATGHQYQGINILLLWIAAMEHGFSTDRWLTYRQALNAGGHVRKGEQGHLAVLYKPMSRPEVDQNGQPVLDEETGQQVEVHYAVIRSFVLFNVDQCEGLSEEVRGLSPENDWHFDPVTAADEVIWNSGAVIRHGGNRAFYRPSADVIQMPEQSAFFGSEHYYATLLHELAHWTGHASRLNREGIVQPPGYNKQDYAFEELVAELGAAFLCTQLGIQGDLRHEGYIESWLKVLRGDKKAIFKASGQARQASEFLLASPAKQLEKLEQQEVA